MVFAVPTKPQLQSILTGVGRASRRKFMLGTSLSKPPRSVEQLSVSPLYLLSLGPVVYLL